VPGHLIDAAMDVATIAANAVSGSLPADEKAHGRRVCAAGQQRLDYNGAPDYQQVGAQLKATNTCYRSRCTPFPRVTNDGYTLQGSRGIRIWMNADRTGAAEDEFIPATADHIVYIEGVDEVSSAPFSSSVYETLSIKGATYSKLDGMRVHVFEMNGPLDVPGAAPTTISQIPPLGARASPPEGHW